MATVFAITPEHGYALAAMAFTGLLGQWHAIVVGTARKAAGVPYPNAYVTHEDAEKDIKKYQFNCAQRSHANYMENLAVVFPLMVASAPLYPMATAVLGGIWSVGRIFYTLGYKSSKQGDGGKGRYQGVFYNIGQLGLLITAGMSVYKMCCPQ
ncbi:uncharacterized protein LAJ45_09103 [Morchella importuna]|uniref:Membrane-associated proteins in eicosanoid and glutathione metabolism n=1 Tax=Morchella conica CCBAS932 TaxID=1392247 RepID=A0A3N4KPQ7_9PEZI|nr:uncharacterized protein LAJ45_09103 [Morchella importuna]KAH8146729.1 hypothetical protein LAJ45_09103 [Morchella importuna]RPB12584.1 membrane-associated proteins in eicosanoid and glutathione metabolism [Morchella conica CCBAS932]